MEVLGKIQNFLETQEGEGKNGNWKKASFLLKEDGDYGKLIKFDYFGSGEKVEYVDNLLKYNKVGDTVKVSFNVESREYNGKYYTNATAWRVSNENQSTQSDDVEPASIGDDDDLPF
ncbi:MAG: DUF3127 domain-containing protein [Pseudoalteromonas sp.]|uniref:DUF3127 domain-containing protein n=1 Tax=Pseudoalteromonas sp. TaxID=53249 RepID=UPI001DE4D023|nr:DUF3127 domain-containing protein [Pseudoalteromonas sp.]NRA78770.1 DUF3127 domain-containing protein [Pseudoalteromonas sp.]